MNNYEIKLNCPMCKVEFITSRTDKIWCSLSCSKSFRLIKEDLKLNRSTQERHLNTDRFRYDIELNKWFLNLKK
jgi:ribosomal protein L37AE/L43A